MIILKKKKEERFEYDESTFKEMSLQPISKDDLPFDIIVKSPEKDPEYHAHIYKKGSKRLEDELGAFILTTSLPKNGNELVGYEKGPHKGLRNIPMEWRDLITHWAKKSNDIFNPDNNWVASIKLYRLALRSRG